MKIIHKTLRLKFADKYDFFDRLSVFWIQLLTVDTKFVVIQHSNVAIIDTDFMKPSRSNKELISPQL